MPKRFALKELIAPKVFPLGQNKDIRDFLPLNEAAIQRILRHLAIVETYWADVRCLDPDTNQPLDIGADALHSWTSLDDVENINKTVTMTPQVFPVKAVKLQMRIAMEHCDLGALPSSACLVAARSFYVAADMLACLPLATESGVLRTCCAWRQSHAWRPETPAALFG